LVCFWQILILHGLLGESEKSRAASKILEESSTAKNFREGKLYENQS
jgi:hypothetical protein